jgi:protein-S-isoprenylcysteine O-methyltransferase Ste14
MRADVTTGLRTLIGSGDRIGLLTLPFLIVAILLSVGWPASFDVGGPPTWLRVASLIILMLGVANWLWCAILILRMVPGGELITGGPYAVVKHPLYIGMAFLVLPWLGFLLNTWLGAALGVVVYIASRMFAPAEEVELAKRFGEAWDRYAANVLLPWL